MGDPKIIVVANLKGGVGKTTLCISYANYLVKEKGMAIGGIIDCDPQGSVMAVHEQDIREAKGTPLTSLYDVVPLNLENSDMIPEVIEGLRKENQIYIFDTPGHLGNMGMVYLLAEADLIICPFCFDSKTLDSTLQFLKFWNNIKARIETQTQEKVATKLFLVPNDIDNRFGTIRDKEKWRDFEQKLRSVAIVTDQIRHTANMTKVSTLDWKDNQKELVIKACLCIDQGIHGSPLYESPKQRDTKNEESLIQQNNTDDGMEESNN